MSNNLEEDEEVCPDCNEEYDENNECSCDYDDDELEDDEDD